LIFFESAKNGTFAMALSMASVKFIERYSFSLKDGWG
jgi:hypothetical protein